MLIGAQAFFIEICLARPCCTLLPARTRLGFAKGYGDWRRLVEDPEVDVVDITTPNHLHVEPALAAIEAGKHVYCEKPMAVKLADAQSMAATARKAGVK